MCKKLCRGYKNTELKFKLFSAYFTKNYSLRKIELYNLDNLHNLIEDTLLVTQNELGTYVTFPSGEKARPRIELIPGTLDL